MTVHVNISEQDLSASDLIDLIQTGEEVILARGGQPVATLRKLDANRLAKPRIGALAHLGKLNDPYIFHGPDTEFAPDKDIFPQ